MASPILVIHGGTDTVTISDLSPEQLIQYKKTLRAALEAGYEILKHGGEAMDAAVQAVSVLEDDPLFNAGKGSAFNLEGKNELEASLMLSKPPSTHPDIPLSRRSLGLTLLTRTRNPSRLARSLYLSPSKAPHPFLSGAAAEALSDEPPVDPSYFFAKHPWTEHRAKLGLPIEPYPVPDSNLSTDKVDLVNPNRLLKGTVGAVALDSRGCIAVVTSTGGKTNKNVGRIGDTPTIGAGFWAEEWNTDSVSEATRAVGISGTGDGDFFILKAVSATIAHRMRFIGEDLVTAAAHVVEELRQAGGIGGVIALDDKGNVTLPFNCSSMYRGVIKKDGVPKVAVFADEQLE